MSQSPRRYSTLFVAIAMVAPTIGLLLPTALAEEGEDIRVVAVYRGFALVPADADFTASGVAAGYRFESVPAIIVSGPSSRIEALRGDAGLEQIVYDGPVEFHLQTAVVASKARDVWGDVWHGASGIAPITKNGQPIDGRGVTVGIVDSGVNALHPDLWYAPLAVAPGVTPEPKVKECVHTTGIVGPVTVATPNCDENVGHGTHVAGIVAGTGMMADMGFTVRGRADYNGAAPGASLAVAGLGVETVALGGLIIDGLAGLDWQYRNADLFGTRVVTNSWSTQLGCSGNVFNDGDLYHAITNKLVLDKGITVLWAANNDGGDDEPIGTSPQARNTMPGVIMVANYDDLGSGTRDGNIALSSGDGCVKTGGSTNDMIWTWPDVAAPGTNIVSTATGIDGVIGMAPIFVGSTPLDAPFYTTLTGTSMATPHVAGVAALLYQAYPDITPAQVEKILIETSRPFFDNVLTRGVDGSEPYWGPRLTNSHGAGFVDKSLCRITPALAARAEANDPTLDALYPGFRQLAQPRLVNGVLVDADANLYVCRDFKRGHGLIDAEAAVREALRLAGDGDGEPEIKIEIPSPGQVVTDTMLLVEGLVDRLGQGPNSPPVATIAASPTSGPAPLDVAFSLSGIDSDGSIVSFTLDYGDGSAALTGASVPTTTVPHTYAADGSYEAKLTVVDDEGASAEATIAISVGGLPATNERVTGTHHAYYTVPGSGSGLDPWVLTGLALGLANEENVVPFYAPGQTVRLSSRAVKSTDPSIPVTLSTTASFYVFEADGTLAAGPLATRTVDDTDLEGNFAAQFAVGEFVIPVSWSGRYLLGLEVHSPSGGAFMQDTRWIGHAPIDVVGPDDVVPSLPGTQPGSDEGHSIGDPDDDGTLPPTEILWADTRVNATHLTTVIRVVQVPPQPAGDSPFIYATIVNGVHIESYILGGHAVWDITHSQFVDGGTTEWDPIENTVTTNIPLPYLTSVGAGCPCTGHVQTMLGEGQLGGVMVMDRAPNTGERDLRAAWERIVPGARVSSQGDPDNTDPEGDPLLNFPDPAPDVAHLPHVDVTKVWVSRETSNEIDLTLEVADLGSSPPSFDAGNPFRASWTYGIDFCANNAAQTYSGSGNFAGVSGVVCYRLSAASGELGVQHSGGAIQKDGRGSCGITGLSKNVEFNTAASTITWTVNLTLMKVSVITADVAACNAFPQTRDAEPPTAGNILSRFAGNTGFSGPVVTAILDDMDANAARPYRLGNTAPLVADAGPDLQGLVGESLALVGSSTGGTLPHTCAWSSSGGTILDPASCSTSVVFAAAGTHVLTLTVTDGAGNSAIDTASADITSLLGERVEVVVGGVRTAVADVSTSAQSPTADWSVNVDVSGLPSGDTDVIATWYDADGTTVLGTATRTVNLQLDPVLAVVEILSPAESSQVSGVSFVTGTAGHTGGGGSGSQTGLNHYGLPVWSGMRGARASVTLEGFVNVPCAGCTPGALNKPVQQIPNAVWNPVANNANPLLFDNLGTSVSWLDGPESPANGQDGYWFNIAGHGGDDFELSDAFNVEMDIRFFNDWLDAQEDELGGVNGPQMPKTGSVPSSANWAFVYIRKGTVGTAANQWGGGPELKLTPVIVPPGAVQALAATSGPGTVTLTWAAPLADGGELLGYKVLRDGVLLNTVTTPGYVDSPGDTAQHLYTVTPYNSAGDGAPTGITAAANPPPAPLSITNPIDGAVAVSPATTVDGTYSPGSTGGGGGGGNSAFRNTHYVALLNLNSHCGGNLGYGDHVILERLTDHAIDVLGVPANNIHVYNEGNVALSASVDASNYNRLGSDWKTGAVFDGPARWSVFAPALRDIADTAAAGEIANGAPARIFFFQSSHGLQAPLVLGDGVTDSVFCLMDGDVSSTMLGDLLNDIDADVATAHPGVAIEWSINVDCSFCGGFIDSPLPAPSTSAVASAGVVGPNRVVEVGCTWVTECFGNPAVTYDHMFNMCVFTGDADGFGPMAAALGPGGQEILVGNPSFAAPDGVITLEESYWCAIEKSHELGADPIATQQMFQIDDQLLNDMFALGGFPIWELDSSLDLANQDPSLPLDLTKLPLPDVRITDPEGDAHTPAGDLLSLEASATATDILATLGVADLTLSSPEVEDVVEYRLSINGDRFGACYAGGSVLVYGYDIPTGQDPVTGEDTFGTTSDGTAVYDVANGLIDFTIPRGELRVATLPARVFATSHYGECSVIMPIDDDTTDTVQTSEDDDPPVQPIVDKVTVALSGPASLGGDATLNAAAGTWTYDPVGELAAGLWTATATHYRNEGSGFVQLGAPVAIEFRVGVEDVTPPSVPGTPVTLGATASTIRLGWTASTDNVGVDHYEIFRNGASVGTSPVAEFLDTGLAAATTYTYFVKAFDAAGNSATGNSATASTTSDPNPIGLVTLRAGNTLLGTDEIDLSTGDPAGWSIEVDWTVLPTGETTITAEYDDGEGQSAEDSILVVVTRGVEIAITDPLEGANVLPTFTTRGTVEGTGGPEGVDASTYLYPTGVVNPWHNGYGLATQTNTLQALESALAGSPGFLGVAPDLAGAPVIRAYYSGDAPAVPASLVPPGWTFEMVEDVELQRGVSIYKGKVPISRVREGPPAPAQAAGIGPGSHLLMTMQYAPGFTFSCTANFVWKDQNGDYYLGAAGHCFLPNPIPGGPQRQAVATHGPGADYNPTETTIRVCVSNCQFGGALGFEFEGNTVSLGHPTYARQTGPGGNIGNDFGIVKIPQSLYGQLRPELPVWNGPVVEGSLTTGEPVLVYGNAVGFGEVWPTMARAGFGGVSQSATRWGAIMPSMQGDSGSALVSGVATGTDTVMEGREAIGVLTHLVVGTGGPVAGTTMGQSKAMATQAGLTITPVLQGQTISPPQPTVPDAPTLDSLSPGSSTMTLSWTPPLNDGNSAITGYTVRYGTSAGSYTQTQTTGAVTTTTVTGLTPATEYFFVVAATNAVGTGANSNELSATTQVAPTVPGAPRNLAATPTNGGVNLAWDAPASDGGSPITHYTVSWTGPTFGSVNTIGRSLLVDGLQNGVQYTFRVTATNEVGTGPASDPVDATPNGPIPPVYAVEIRADAGGVEVFGWRAVDTYDGSSFEHRFADAPGGALDVTVRVLQDGVPVATHSIGVHVLSPPEITLPTSVSGNEREAVTFTATATDPDGPGGLTFSLVSAPAGASIGAGSGEFSWTPQFDDAGTHDVVVRVTDPEGLTDEGTVQLVIGAANRPPVLVAIGNREIGEGELLSFTVTATDHENDPLTFTADPLPQGATFVDRTFSWTPEFGTEGNYDVKFRVSDGLASDEETITISVGNVNRPPVLGTIGARTTAEAELLAFTVGGTDPDVGDVLTFTATGLPTGATFVAGAFAWTPSYTQAGSYDVTFRVSDGDLVDTEIVTITVTNVDRAPTMVPIPSASILQLSTLQIPLLATDPDVGDTFLWSVNGPAGMTIDQDGDGTATLRWTPTLEQLGAYTATVFVRTGPDQLLASRSFVATALFRTDFTATFESAAVRSASPGEVVTHVARITNTGPQTDTFSFSSGASATWALSLVTPSSATLAPGESVLVSVSTSVPANTAVNFVTIYAASEGDGTTVKSARFRVEVPVVVENIAFEQSAAGDLPRGSVHVRFLDGAPAAGAQITVTQTHRTLGGATRSSQSGIVAADGSFAFDFTRDAGAMTPGEHQFLITARWSNGPQATVATAYTVGRLPTLV